MKIRITKGFSDFKKGAVVEALISFSDSTAVVLDITGCTQYVFKGFYEIVEEKQSPDKPESDEPRSIGNSLISAIGTKPSKITIEF